MESLKFAVYTVITKDHPIIYISDVLSTMFLHLMIINKSGGLIHHRALSEKAPKISTNDWLRIGSTFHSLHAIAAAAATPLNCPQNTNAMGADDGIEEIVAKGMILRCLQTRTGIKFVLTAESDSDNIVNLDAVLREIYILYTDCALKDPFYELEMPIRCELFTLGIDTLIQRYDKTTTSIRR
jgi:trafficking protein particle complex subunit 4